MSLDVYLVVKGVRNIDLGEAIYVREDGVIKQVTRDEWDKRYPDREPVTVNFPDRNEEVYTANITHNLGKMAGEAGIYQYLWRPDEINIVYAEQLIEPLHIGLILLENNPARFKRFNPVNGWGTYDGLVAFVRDYLNACEEYPTAEIDVWR